MYAFGLLACQLVVCISYGEEDFEWGGERWRELKSDEPWKRRLVKDACEACPEQLSGLQHLVRQCLASACDRPTASTLQVELFKLRESNLSTPVESTPRISRLKKEVGVVARRPDPQIPPYVKRNRITKQPQ